MEQVYHVALSLSLALVPSSILLRPIRINISIVFSRIVTFNWLPFDSIYVFFLLLSFWLFIRLIVIVSHGILIIYEHNIIYSWKHESEKGEYFFFATANWWVRTANYYKILQKRKHSSWRLFWVQWCCDIDPFVWNLNSNNDAIRRVSTSERCKNGLSHRWKVTCVMVFYSELWKDFM